MSDRDTIEVASSAVNASAASTHGFRKPARERCVEPEAVMAAWEEANAAAGMDGRLHLDLLLTAEA